MWEVYETARGVHVVPAEDLVEHELAEDCVCGPAPRIVPRTCGADGWTFVHASADGRELHE